MKKIPPYQLADIQQALSEIVYKFYILVLFLDFSYFLFTAHACPHATFFLIF